MKTIALGTDHAGFHYKEAVKKHLQNKGIKILDFGSDSDERCDYPDFVAPASRAVANGDADGAVVFGGSGNGEAMVANKIPGIRCGVCWNTTSAKLTKQHNDANVISIGERMVTEEVALQIVDAWMESTFEGDRHIARIAKVDALLPKV